MNSKTLSNYIINRVSDFAKDKKKNWWIGIYEDIATKWFCIKNPKLGRLCIDEKDIQWQVYTILSNSDTWELIAMYPGVKSKEVIDFLCKHLDIERRHNIEEISADMSPTIEAIIDWVFPNAELVSDRFHVMKNLLEDVWAIRTRIKTAIKNRINNEAKIYEKTKKSREYGKSKNQKTSEKQSIWRPKQNRYKPPKHTNWETDIDLITRIVRQIRKRKVDWNTNQDTRREIAKEIPELADLVEGYDYLHKLRDIYDDRTNTVEVWRQKIEWRILEWSKIRNKIVEVDNVISTIEDRFESICNYFISRHTNWFAEWLNSRIQKMISMSRWFINKDYMIYRILKLCSTNKSHLV